jgi:hypothetical protein
MNASVFNQRVIAEWISNEGDPNFLLLQKNKDKFLDLISKIKNDGFSFLDFYLDRIKSHMS